MPIEYTDPIELTELPQLIRAVNTKTGYLPSNVVDATYTQIQVETPTFNPGSSTVPYPVNVTINCATSGAVILYSIDGSEPSLTYSGPVAVSSSTPLKAKATKANYLTSDIGSAVYSQAQVPIVTFSPNSSAVVFPQTVYLATTLGDATIYYTIGSNPPDPTTSDILYDPNTGIVVNSAVTIKAFGVKTGYINGDVSSATYTQVQVATPTFSQSYNSGNSYWYPNTVTLSCATSSVTMYYTVDGSTPTTSSTLYSAPFDITSSVTVKALAVRSGYLNSAIGSRVYDQQRVTATPTITQNNSEAGIPNATGALYPTVVTISGESGATFRYTTDGSTPSGSSTLYSAPFNNLNVATIKVKSFKTNYVDSTVVTQTYTQRVVVAPTFSHPGGEIVLGSTVSISTTTPGCSIYYTVDGSTPTNASTLYTAPVTINAALTLKAIAYKTSGFQFASWGVSTVTSASYIGPLAPVPTISPDGSGAYEFPVRVVLTAVGADAIYYTVDGSTPDNTDTLYTGNYFTITDTTTVKAVGTKAGYTDSAVVAATITKATSQRRGWATPASGAAIPDNQSVTIAGTHDTGSGLVNPTGFVSGVYYTTVGQGIESVVPIQLRSGKILLVGRFTKANEVSRNRIARVYPEYGVTDTTFADSQITDSSQYLTHAAELPDGSLIVAGNFSTYQGVTKFFLAKLNSDGTLNTNFTAYTNGIVYQVAYFANRIYLVGSFTQVFPTGGGGQSRPYFAVLNLDGTMTSVPDAAPTFPCFALAISGGSTPYVYVAGASCRIQKYQLYNSSITLQIGWTSANAIVVHNVGSVVDMKITVAGKLLVAGTLFQPGFFNNTDYKALLQLNTSDGTLDSGFTAAIPGVQTQGNSVAVDLDGNVWLGGYNNVSSVNAGWLVLKLDSTGAIDNAFTTELLASSAVTAKPYSSRIALDYGDRPIVGWGGGVGIYNTSLTTAARHYNIGKVARNGTFYKGVYGNNIKFTLNGTTPTTASSDWPGSINLTQDAEVFPTIKTKIRSIPLNGFELGTMDTYDYTWIQVATPVATPGAGAVGLGSTVALSCATSGAAIYYTVDGSTPDNTDTLYTAPITISSALTIKAIAYKADYKTSAVLSAAYTQATVATPVASPTANAVALGSTVALSCATSGATIHYTIDDSTPLSTLNRLPTLTTYSDSDFVVSASSEASGFPAWQAFDNNAGTYWLSGTGSSTLPAWLKVATTRFKLLVTEYKIKPGSSELPTNFKLQGSNDNSTWTDLDTRTAYNGWSGTTIMTFSVTGNTTAYLYHRLYITAVVSGGNPHGYINALELRGFGPVYIGPVTIDAACNITANGVKTGFIDSSSMFEAYTQAQAATPVATPTGSAVQFGSTVSLACSSPSGASILYTIDGSAPLPRGPIGRWRLDGNTTDSIGGINGTLIGSGAAFTSGGIAGGQALSTTSSGAMSMTGSTGLFHFNGKDFSIAIWIKTTHAGNNAFIAGKHQSGTSNGYFLGLNTTGSIGVAGKSYFYASSGSVALTSQTTVNDNSWHHLVGVYGANGKMRFYIDGAPYEAIMTSPSIVTNGIPLTVGYVPNVGNFCPGLYNDLQLYDRALTSAEVAALYATPASIVGDAETLVYSTPLTVSSAQTIKAIALKADYLDSGTMSEAYTQAQLANVIFNPVDGTSGVSLVTLSNAVSGTTIRYTINGSTPTISNGFTYSGPIGIVTPKTVKAYALKTGYIDSNVATATYP